MSLEYKKLLSDEDLKLFDSHGIDPQKWIDEAVRGKLHNMRKRILKHSLDHAAMESGRAIQIDLDNAIKTFKKDFRKDVQAGQ